MDEKILDFQKVLNQELERLDQQVSPFKEKNPDVKRIMDDIRNIYDTKLKQAKPQIMVFGIYNAGKSSILNELMREDKAKVDDVPTTDHVEYYTWHGYSVADTPGVGAPIQHEEVTNEAIRKADVVLFVMSTSGSSEKKENYTRMKDIVDTGKKVIIVLNDKNGDLLNDQKAVFVIRQKVYDNMQTMGIADVNNKFTIVTVNAALAHNGRVGNKPVLWEKSNMPELESVILTELKKTTAFDILRHATYEISKDVDELRNVLKAKDQSAAFSGIQDVLDALRKGKKQMRDEMNRYITAQTTRLAESLPGRIWAVKDNQEETSQVVQKEQEDLAAKVQAHLKDQLELVIEDLSKDLEQYVSNLKKLELETARDVNVTPVEMEANPVSMDSNLSPRDVVGNISGAILEGQLTSKAYQELAKQTGDFAKELIKNAGGKIGKKSVTDYAIKKLGVDKMAETVLSKMGVKTLLTKAIPIPPVEVILVGYTILKALLGDDGSYERERMQAERENAIAERKIQAEQQVMQQLRQNCVYMADDLKDELIYWSNQAIRDTLGKYEESLNEKMKSLMSAEEDSFAVADNLSRISDDYHKLAVNLETGTV